jgi:hypothetical protein
MSDDATVLQAIRDALIATKEFDGVYADLPEFQGEAASDRTAAVVAPLDFDENDGWDDPTDVLSTRHVRWNLMLIVREEDNQARQNELARLFALAQNELDGKSLGSITLPAFTRLRKGRYRNSNSPEQCLKAVGEFTYLVHGFGGHTAS